MPLHDLIGLRQADAAACFLRREVEFEYFVLHGCWNPGALIANFSHHCTVILTHSDRKCAAVGHSLNTIKHHVKNRLFDQIHINSNRNMRVRQFANQLDPVLRRIGSG